MKQRNRGYIIIPEYFFDVLTWITLVVNSIISYFLDVDYKVYVMMHKLESSGAG